MLDIRFIREHAEEVQENARRKGYDVSIKELLERDEAKRQLQQQADELRAQRNEIAARMKDGRPADDMIAEGKAVKEQLAAVETNLKEADDQFTTLLKAVPNMALPDVPVGASEDENIVVKTVGTPAELGFAPRSHYDIAVERGWIDKERAAKVTGARFAYIKGDLVRLQLAIINFVLDTLTNGETLKTIADGAGLSVSTKPFVPVLPPLMIRTDMYDAMDRLEPRDDRYKLEEDDLWLQGSAEHVLGSMHAGEIFEEKDLPLRYVGYATSFRREAGTYGKDMDGILRMHQFDKLEMESFTVGEAGLNEHLFFVAIQEYLLSSLGLPYEVIQKCTADIGKPNARGIDMNTWLPGQGAYRETHTADYMTDYQTRRLKTRVRREGGSLELAHTNDATAFALGRIMIAIIENGQMADGRVGLPLVLQPYLGGRSTL
jgi:seryl-tRNA synthetase